MFGGFWQLDRTTSVWKAGSSSLYVEKIFDFEKISAQKFNLGEKQTSTRDIFLGQQDILLYPVRTEPRTVRPVRRFSRACRVAPWIVFQIELFLTVKDTWNHFGGTLKN